MIYIIGMACMTGTLSAQTVVDYSTFEQKVLDYSQTLKQSVAQRTAMQKAMKRQKPLSSRLLMQREAISIVLTNTRWILAEWLFLWSTIHTVPK